MTEDEAVEVQAALERILADHNLEWVVDQFHRQRDEGITNSERVTAPPTSGLGEDPRPISGELIVARPYTAKESLALLINAVRIVLTQLPLLEEYVFNTFYEQSQRSDISFVPPPGGQSINVGPPSPDETTQRSQLLPLLTQLDASVNASN